jgi:hypothetical protein
MSEHRAPERLPDVLAVFPLTGVLLLPGTVLPLHIFEPRYRHLVQDALEADGVFGMIQPYLPRPDSRPPPGAENDAPQLYEVGCAGWIEHHDHTPDGRYMLLLRGLARFRVLEELPPRRGYRRVRADYSAFGDPAFGNPTPPAGFVLHRKRLLGALEAFSRAQGQEIATAQVDALDDLELLHAMAVSLPFHPTEKQALLEAPTLAEREAVLIELLRMGAEPPGEDEAGRSIN